MSVQSGSKLPHSKVTNYGGAVTVRYPSRYRLHCACHSKCFLISVSIGVQSCFPCYGRAAEVWGRSPYLCVA